MRQILIPAVTAALVTAAMLYQARAVNPTLAEAPETRLGEIAGFVSEVVPPSESELYVLPKDTRLDKRAYTGEGGVTHAVTLVTSGVSKGSIHRPEMCLPTQGFQMMDPRDATVGGVDWHLVTLARRDAPPVRFAYTFVNQEGFRTSSHVRRIFRDVWDRSIHGRIDRWVMVTVYSTAADDATFKAFLGRLRGVVK